jgi:hypothetical protein
VFRSGTSCSRILITIVFRNSKLVS